MVIEFVGLPGSGKSFLLKKIEEQNHNITCISTERYYSLQKEHSHFFLLCRTLFFILSHFKLLIYIRALKYPKQNIKKDFFLMFYLTNYRVCIEKYDRCDIVLIDQGLVQRIWYPFYRNRVHVTPWQGAIIKDIVKYVHQNTKVNGLFLKIKPERAAVRAIKRKGDCFADNMEYEDLFQLYRTAVENTDFIGQVFEKCIFVEEEYNINSLITKIEQNE